jgi:hypothetical protein
VGLVYELRVRIGIRKRRGFIRTPSENCRWDWAQRPAFHRQRKLPFAKFITLMLSGTIAGVYNELKVFARSIWITALNVGASSTLQSSPRPGKAFWATVFARLSRYSLQLVAQHLPPPR